MNSSFGYKFLCALGVVISLCICVIAAEALAASIAKAGTLPTLNLTVQNVNSAVPTAQVAAAEQAVTTEVNTDFRRFWNVPEIQFVPSGGTPILLYHGKGIWGAAGAHNYGSPLSGATATKTVWAFVATGSAADGFTVVGSGGSRLSWTVGLSHEIMEMLVNPYLNRRVTHKYQGHRVWTETCDAVEANTLQINGFRLSDFVTPRWFDFGHSGRFDYLAKVHRAFRIAPGGYMPGSAADRNHNAL